MNPEESCFILQTITKTRASNPEARTLASTLKSSTESMASFSSKASNMFSLSNLPSASTMFSTYASLATSTMLIRSMVNDFIPHQLQSYILSALRSLFAPRQASQLTLIVEEYFSGMNRNQVYEAAEMYVSAIVSPSVERLKVCKAPREKNFTFTIDKGEEVVDCFEGVQLKWRFVCSVDEKSSSTEQRYFEISFNKRDKEKVLGSYLPHVLNKSKDLREENKVVNLYTLGCFYDDMGGGGGGGVWGSINLDHPATFDTLAMDPELKKALIDDLDRFVKRKDFYKKVGKAWKRGYLLYGPPGTGKSSLIAAMANYLKFDIYDLELSQLRYDSELRRLLVATANRSILVIEDIDCSVQLHDRQFDGTYEVPNDQLTLSGVLNFIDGLWSSCGDERIIVFTSNHKDRLDPALLRPGRMDMHIHMSYCTMEGFKLLAFNYHGVKEDHPLLGEIEGLMENTEVTPAEVAEELMKSDQADTALNGVIDFLRRKKMEEEKIKADEKGKEPADCQEPNKEQKSENEGGKKQEKTNKRRNTKSRKSYSRNRRRPTKANPEIFSQ
ncbi:PREDICTED: AAA-ATPase At2g18193-like [Nelumbo nucifera]|uniref:AAA+ ATPase domain-containing protein n=2 Tax=Nelumbo nucifera TaxID=4432 RepID=A0A822Z4X1_NELNU|nr:PREDICTED: AAA-ATPase At2g18193-like [Nelumbo nucifera]DAD36578.1 TPA_asm: hypothetical protein HUJ06_007219 [Nelumbo nucifera]